MEASVICPWLPETPFGLCGFHSFTHSSNSTYCVPFMHQSMLGAGNTNRNERDTMCLLAELTF